MRGEAGLKESGLRRIGAAPALALAAALALVLAVSAGAKDAATPETSSSRAGDLGLLDWGNPPRDQEWSSGQLREKLEHSGSDTLGLALKRAMGRAAATLGEKTPVLEELHLEHVLFSDPRHKKSLAATAPLEDSLLWALCSRIARSPVRERCGKKAANLALDWLAAYAPTGNPIDENRFVPLFQAIDLLTSADASSIPEPLKDSNKVRALKAWVRSFARAGDRFYSELPPQTERRSNNWMSWRLLIRGMAAAVGADPALQMSTVQMFKEHLQANIADDGSTLDFHQRDALHYQVYDLEALVQAYLYLPWAIDAQGGERILKAVQFLEPYVTGTKQHVEFAHSTVKFDEERRKAGDPAFQLSPWKPQAAGFLLALSRARFEQVRSWGKSSPLAPKAHPRLELLEELYNER